MCGMSETQGMQEGETSQNKPLISQETAQNGIESRYRKHVCTRTSPFINTSFLPTKSVNERFLSFCQNPRV